MSARSGSAPRRSGTSDHLGRVGLGRRCPTQLTPWSSLVEPSGQMALYQSASFSSVFVKPVPRKEALMARVPRKGAPWRLVPWKVAPNRSALEVLAGEIELVGEGAHVITTYNNM